MLQKVLSCLEALSKTVSDLSLQPSEHENYRAQGFERVFMLYD